MKLIVDARETALENALRAISVPFTTDSLALGDAVIVNEGGESMLIFERKTWQDLASSISDGRYNEQSTRLQASGINNHHVIYVIEGNIRGYVARGHVSKEALRSAVVSLSYFKGFSVMMTTSTSDTAQLLADFLRKVTKEIAAGRTPMVGGGESVQVESFAQLQQRGKRKIQPGEIEAAMLAQIPGLNATMACNVLSAVTFRELIDTKGAAAEAMTYTTSAGKTRKIPCSVIKSLKEYLANV